MCHLLSVIKRNYKEMFKIMAKIPGTVQSPKTSKTSKRATK